MAFRISGTDVIFRQVRSQLDRIDDCKNVIYTVLKSRIYQVFLPAFITYFEIRAEEAVFLNAVLNFEPKDRCKIAHL